MTFKIVIGISDSHIYIFTFTFFYPFISLIVELRHHHITFLSLYIFMENCCRHIFSFLHLFLYREVRAPSNNLLLPLSLYREIATATFFHSFISFYIVELGHRQITILSLYLFIVKSLPLRFFSLSLSGDAGRLPSL